MQAPPPISLDEIAAGLQQLRLVSGNVSFADLTARIARNRVEAGKNGHASRVARTTVYACFQPGRTRINSDLIAEIVLALTGDAEVAAYWRQLCLDAHRATDPAIASEPAIATVPPLPSLQPVAQPAVAFALPDPTSSASTLGESQPQPLLRFNYRAAFAVALALFMTMLIIAIVLYAAPNELRTLLTQQIQQIPTQITNLLATTLKLLPKP